MFPYKVLVLDDEQKWLNSHQEALEEEGIKCVCVQQANEAIKLAKEDRSIVVALIDEILLQPRCVLAETEPDPQNLTGRDVIRRIRVDRPEISFVMISAKPFCDSKGDARRLLEEERKLRVGAIPLYHKWNLEQDPDGEYARLVQTIKDFLPETYARSRVLVGLGIDNDIYERIKGIKEVYKGRKSWWVDLLRSTDPRLRETLYRNLSGGDIAVRQEQVFYLGPGARLPSPIPKVGPSGIRILRTLAWKAVLSGEKELEPKDYPNESLGALKTAKSRLESHLKTLDPKLRFQPLPHGCYKALFDVSIMLYSVDAPGPRRSAPLVRRS